MSWLRGLSRGAEETTEAVGEESMRDKRNGGEKPVPVGGKSFDDMTLAIPSATSSVTATSMASFAAFVASAAASPSVTLTG